MRPNAFNRFFVLLILLVASASHAGVENQQVTEGCQGEGCECFQEYRSGETKKGTPIQTIRPFIFYSRMDKNSKQLGNFKPGKKAIPLKFKTVAIDRGEYLVTKVKNNDSKVSVGDKLNTIVNLGEGEATARRGNVTVHFDFDQVELKQIRKPRMEQWLQLSVNGSVGFTPDEPFENCLE